MDKVLGGLVPMNGTDIWTEYGAFLVEEKRGGVDNLTAILTPSKVKTNTTTNIREEQGEKYSFTLTPRNEPRDVTLTLALYSRIQTGWLKKYFTFINSLKQGNGGWIDIGFPQLGPVLHVKYSDSSKLTPLTYIWKGGVHAGRFKMKFCEPVLVI